MTDLHDISIKLHIGAPETDNEQLVWSLRRDVHTLMEQGVMVRRPGTYNKALRHLLEMQATGDLTDKDRDEFLAGNVKDIEIERMILSYPTALGMPGWMLHGGRLFRNAGQNTEKLREVFAGNTCEFFLGLRNPATLIPAVFAAQNRSWEEFIGSTDVRDLRWSEVVQDILESNADCRLTIWSNEETPVIWPSILGRISGLGGDFRFSGDLDIIRTVMPEASIVRMEEYLAGHPEFSEKQRNQVRAIFLNRFHLENEVEQEIDVPGWSQDLVDEVTDRYHEDLFRIERMEDVVLMS